MSFQPVFGAGGVIYPAQQTLVEIDLTANTTLNWPTEQQVGGANIAAAIVDVVATAGPWAITLGDARVVSNGYAILFHNLGANIFSVRDQGLSTLLTVASGEAWVLYLRDNLTTDGDWEIFQQGAGTSTTNAASLAGAGIKAVTTTLNQKMDVDTHAAPYVVLDADRAKLLSWIGGAGTFTLPNAATVGEDWFCAFKNMGSGSVVITPSVGTIDGTASLTLTVGESTFMVSDGTNWLTVGLGQEVNSVFDFASIDVAGTGNYTLSGAELNRISYEFIGLLTGNRTIIVPATIQQYWVDNSTTGAFTLTVKTAAGSGVTIPQGSRNIVYCDGTDVIVAVTFSSLTFEDGSLSAPSITFTADINTGFYRSATDTFIAVAGATAVAGFSLTGGNPQLSIAAGSAAAPSLAFLLDLDTGAYRVGANVLGFAANGSLIASVGTAGLTVESGILAVQNGGIAAPSVTFEADPNTGFYSEAADVLGMTVGGVQTLVVAPTAATFRTTVGSANGTLSSPGFQFDSDVDSGMRSAGANILQLVAGGSVTAGASGVIQISTTAILLSTPIMNFSGYTTAGAAGAVALYLPVTVNGSSYKIPLHNT